jgi:release factor glutamine methyltransferase
MTVLECIQKSTDFLARKGLDSPRLQAELLLAHVLNMPRMKLYLNFERALTDSQVETLRAMITRRARREPLQHIIGTVNFCGLELAVTRDVLIPRPETELLVEMAWQWLNGRGPGATALDFGTGSGCLAILLALKHPEARLTAVDVSAPALKLAARNASAHHVSDRIDFVEGEGLAAIAARGPFDLIVSNPPYIATGEIPALEPEVRDHDPHLALDGGPEGLDFYVLLAAQGQSVLKSDGVLMCEFGLGQAEPIRKLFENQNWVVEKILEDYTQRPRLLLASRRK